jgi:hypothetical protein
LIHDPNPRLHQIPARSTHRPKRLNVVSVLSQQQCPASSGGAQHLSDHESIETVIIIALSVAPTDGLDLTGWDHEDAERLVQKGFHDPAVTPARSWLRV